VSPHSLSFAAYHRLMLGQELRAKQPASPDAGRDGAAATRPGFPAQPQAGDDVETRQFRSGELPAHELRRKIEWLGLLYTEIRPFPWLVAVFSVTGPANALDELSSRLQAAAWNWWE
jgi:hypothetical protein